jgi:hypothetical protein
LLDACVGGFHEARLVDLLVVLRSWMKAESEDCHGDVAGEGVERVCNVVDSIA